VCYLSLPITTEYSCILVYERDGHFPPKGFGPGGIYGHSATYVEELGCILIFGGLRYISKHFRSVILNPPFPDPFRYISKHFCIVI
jgi:hypothetical protein